MRAIVNGQLVEVPDGTTIGKLKLSATGVDSSESMARVSGARAEVKSDSDFVEPGGKYRSIPPVKQG